MTEQALVDNILSGNRDAFRDFMSQYQSLVAHVVYRMVPNEADRQDVCQDVFVKAYRNLDGFQFEAKLSTWLARIAYNTALNHLEKRRVDLFDDVTSEAHQLEDTPAVGRALDEKVAVSDSARLVRMEIDRLPVLYGTILSLYHLEEMSYREIADVMQLPEGTVKSYLFRARKMLKDRLSSAYAEEDLCR
ncbi:sigma-70 family RNA polymerase sigma factor [bacterium]|nr:sigma-70 family RNA polymerase sigma factor [bacterium]MCB2201887.1 sigma-70 family RNA polymerase sigma factor [bacterium]